ncbi:MAG: ATP-binding protein [Pseudomonadota bacterium]
MPLNIIPASEPIDVQQITAVIYGQPGLGKTSTGFTSSRPLLLDFDNGAHRSAFRQDTQPVAAWRDVADIAEWPLDPFDTLVIDTAGRALDLLAADIMREDPKLQSGGALNQRGYGSLKARFAGWLKTVHTRGLDVVLLAHDKEDRRNDDVIVRPDITGGSYHEIFKLADLVGYLCQRAQCTLLVCNPTDTSVGKDPAGFGTLEVPDYHQEPTWFADRIADVKKRIGVLSAEGQRVVSEVSDLRELLDKVQDAEGLNAFSTMVMDGEYRPASKAQVRAVLRERVKELGCKYDKKAKAYVPDEAAA